MIHRLKVERATKSLQHFTNFTFPDYDLNWHHAVVFDALDPWVAGEIENLMIFEPPRHGKSEQVSRQLPAYILGRFPDAEVMAASYSADLAQRMNRDVQRIIESREYRSVFPHTRLFGKNIRSVAGNTYLRNSDIFEVVDQKGSYRGAGVGGGIVGMGYDYGIIDDPIKNRQEANSPTSRRNVWEWFISTFYTRQEKNARKLLTATPWHTDDLAGRLLALAMSDPIADQWTELRFPAIADETIDRSYDKRAIGEALWPGKYDESKLAQIRATIGEFEWSAQYQCRPTLAKGGIFKRDNFTKVTYVDPIEIAEVVRFWDLAMSSRTSADYTVGVKMGRYHSGRLVVLDVRRAQKEWDEVPAFMADVAIEDGVNVTIGFEQAGYMSRAGQALASDTRLHGYAIFGYPKDKDKLTNALPFAARVGLKIVDVVDTYWTNTYLDELCAFNQAKNDDQVDASAGAYEMLGPAEENQGSEIVYAEPYSIGGGSY